MEIAIEAYRLGFAEAIRQAAEIVNNSRGTSYDLRGIVVAIRALKPRPDAVLFNRVEE